MVSLIIKEGSLSYIEYASDKITFTLFLFCIFPRPILFLENDFQIEIIAMAQSIQIESTINDENSDTTRRKCSYKVTHSYVKETKYRTEK